jgi:hypothetical protein
LLTNNALQKNLDIAFQKKPETPLFIGKRCALRLCHNLKKTIFSDSLKQEAE